MEQPLKVLVGVYYGFLCAHARDLYTDNNTLPTKRQTGLPSPRVLAPPLPSLAFVSLWGNVSNRVCCLPLPCA